MGRRHGPVFQRLILSGAFFQAGAVYTGHYIRGGFIRCDPAQNCESFNQRNNSSSDSARQKFQDSVAIYRRMLDSRTALKYIRAGAMIMGAHPANKRQEDRSGTGRAGPNSPWLPVGPGLRDARRARNIAWVKRPRAFRWSRQDNRTAPLPCASFQGRGQDIIRRPCKAGLRCVGSSAPPGEHRVAYST